MIKPMLACDWDKEKIKFPVLAQPKIDGVRGLNLEGRLTGRSLKEHKNRYVTECFSHPWFKGLDGELAAGPARSQSLCRDTCSALGTITGQPRISWHVFDFITHNTILLPYQMRYEALKTHVAKLVNNGASSAECLQIVPYVLIQNQNQLDQIDQHNIDQGFEGTILRDPMGRYKQGRSTVRENGLLRIKRFIEDECIVLNIEEGQSNGNEATINELGHTSRSTHSDNMVPNGMVGTLICCDPKTNEECRVSAGCMTHEERLYYFRHPEQIIGKVIKRKHFAHGRKDAPRMATFQSIKIPSDVGV